MSSGAGGLWLFLGGWASLHMTKGIPGRLSLRHSPDQFGVLISSVFAHRTRVNVQRFPNSARVFLQACVGSSINVSPLLGSIRWINQLEVLIGAACPGCRLKGL